MVVQHNIPALNAHRNLGVNNSATAKNMEKLSSGYRVNRAADDAAGLAISEGMRAQIRSLGMAEMNTDNAISLIQTGEGGLNETHAILHRMRELATQAANGTYDTDDRVYLDMELQELKGEIDRVAYSTNYNNILLLDGSMGAVRGDVAPDAGNLLIDLGNIGANALTLSDPGLAGEEARLIINDDNNVYLQIGNASYKMELPSGDFIADGVTIANLNPLPNSGTASGVIRFILGDPNSDFTDQSTLIATENSQLSFQVGANAQSFEQVHIYVGNMSSCAIGDRANGVYVSDLSIRGQDDALAAIDILAQAVDQVSASRAVMGSMQNRMEHTLNNLGVSKENITAAESTIRDSDMAKEMMEFTQNSILVQSAQAMLAQASQFPQGLLQLLR